MNLKHVDGMEIDVDPSFQKREWSVQLVVWIVMGLLVVGALFGLFGEGPLSSTEAADPGTEFSLTYERFARRHGETWLEVDAPGAESAHMELWTDRTYAERVLVRQMIPEPMSVRSDGDRIVYVFESAPAKPFRVRIILEPDEIGLYPGHIGVLGGPSVAFTQFVYP